MTGIVQDHVETFITAADLSAATVKHCFAKITAANTVNKGAAATDAVIGTIVEPAAVAAAGAQIAVQVGGTGYVRAGAAFSAGAKLTCDANGKAVTAGAGNDYFAIAVDAATQADDFVSAVFVRGKLS